MRLPMDEVVLGCYTHALTARCELWHGTWIYLPYAGYGAMRPIDCAKIDSRF